MLGERDYMRRMKEPEQTAASGSMCLLILIAVNVVIWMLGRPFAGHLVLTPEAVRHFELWRFITAAFTHFDFWHLFFNMFGLWMFGSLSAPTLDQRHVRQCAVVCVQHRHSGGSARRIGRGSRSNHGNRNDHAESPRASAVFPRSGQTQNNGDRLHCP